MEETSVLKEIVYLDPDLNGDTEHIRMLAHFEETSILKEITYLDPELNLDLEYSRLRPAATWESVRQFVFSPCVATLAGFVMLLILGASQGS